MSADTPPDGFPPALWALIAEPVSTVWDQLTEEQRHTFTATAAELLVCQADADHRAPAPVWNKMLRALGDRWLNLDDDRQRNLALAADMLATGTPKPRPTADDRAPAPEGPWDGKELPPVGPDGVRWQQAVAKERCNIMLGALRTIAGSLDDTPQWLWRDEGVLPPSARLHYQRAGYDPDTVSDAAQDSMRVLQELVMLTGYLATALSSLAARPASAPLYGDGYEGRTLDHLAVFHLADTWRELHLAPALRHALEHCTTAHATVELRQQAVEGLGAEKARRAEKNEQVQQ